MKDNTTQQKIEMLFDNFKAFLMEKNTRYGDSALEPVNHPHLKAGGMSREGYGQQVDKEA